MWLQNIESYLNVAKQYGNVGDGIDYNFLKQLNHLKMDDIIYE